MIMKRELDIICGTLVELFPKYDVDAADANESLDTGVANCAVRAYVASLLLRLAFPNKELYQIDFGYDTDLHGLTGQGKEGQHIIMGHAVARVTQPERLPFCIETYTDGGIEVISTSDRFDMFEWFQPELGYYLYLYEGGYGDVEVDKTDILSIISSKISGFSCEENFKIVDKSSLYSTSF